MKTFLRHPLLGILSGISLVTCLAGTLYAQNDPLKLPKNIIIMVSDGCGYNHILATNYFMHGQAPYQAFESFPVHYAVSTCSARLADNDDMDSYNVGYNSDSTWSSFQNPLDSWTDSAPAASAIATGNKTYNGSIGMDIEHHPLVNIMQFAHERGKATGTVTSVQVSHVTPGGFTSHNVNRNNFEQIAREMILDSKLDVAMGCGNPDFDRNGQPTTISDYRYVGGKASWDSLLIKSTHFSDTSNTGNQIVQDVDDDGYPDAWTVIQDRSEFQQMKSGPTPKRVFGVVKNRESLQQARSGATDGLPFSVPFIISDPTLAEMSLAALNVLDNNPNGLVLMIEGGAVDLANHSHQKGRLIEEQNDFHQAVDSVIQWIGSHGGWDSTLLIVTADHETGYLTGPNEADQSPVTNPIINNGQGQMPDMKYNFNMHSNMLVPFFAKGAGSELFHQFADETDYLRGKYIDNTEIAQACFLMMPDPWNPPSRPKNIFIMVNEGGGANAQLATRYFTGETPSCLSFPVSCFMSTYPGKQNDNENIHSYSSWYNPMVVYKNFNSVDHDMTQPAAAATALACGVKTYNQAVGVDLLHQPVLSLTELFKQLGKSAGMISTGPWSDPSTAAFACHNINDLNNTQMATDILLDSKLDVLMGCGHPFFNDQGDAVISSPDFQHVGGEENWTGLISGSVSFSSTSSTGNSNVQDVNGDGIPDPWTLIQDRAAFQALASDSPPVRICGISPTRLTLQQKRAGTADTLPFAVPFVQSVPTLDEMTLGALKVLKQNPEGFFLFIDGAGVKMACQDNQKSRLIEEQRSFDLTVDTVIQWIEQHGGWEENLLIVTSSYECGHITGPADSINSAFSNPVIDAGQGNMPEFRFNSQQPSNLLVPVNAKGNGASLLKGFAGHVDPENGKYLNNTEVYQALRWLFSDYLAFPVDTSHQTIQGQLTYHNADHSPLGNSRVLCLDADNNLWGEAVTDQNGNFSLLRTPKNNGAFHLHASTQLSWGGSNATDALLAVQYFVGTANLDPLQQLCGDVNASQLVNAHDALSIQKRWVGLTQSFVKSDWIFENPDISANSDNQNIDFQGICTGDINASYQPSSIRTSPTLYLDHIDIEDVTAGKDFEIPVWASEKMQIGAISFGFQSVGMNIISARLADEEANHDMICNTGTGSLKLSWYSLKPLIIEKEKPWLYIKANVSHPGEYTLDLDNESEWADPLAKVQAGKRLQIPLFRCHPTDDPFVLSCSPNPFSGTTQVKISLPEEGDLNFRILDVMGETLMNYTFPGESAGEHSYKLDLSLLSSGVYLMKAQFHHQGRTEVLTIRLIESHQ